MTERNDFDMYSNFDNKITIRRRDNHSPQVNREEFGLEDRFEKSKSKNIESFADWVDKMTKKLEK